jgi:ATP-dependent Clp protease adapter protein ClpS
MVKIVKFGLVVLNDSEHSFQDVIHTFQSVFGHDYTQAANCANLIHNKGEYAVKWYDAEKDALLMAERLRSVGLKVKILIDNNVEL